MILHYCPVCWREVTRTPHHCIQGHFDKAKNVCPGSYEPFYITIRVDAASRFGGKSPGKAWQEHVFAR